MRVRNAAIAVGALAVTGAAVMFFKPAHADGTRSTVFGLYMGMTLDEIKAVTGPLQEKRDGMYSTSKVPVGHPDIEEYTVIVSPTLGLCKVAGFTGMVETSSFGTELVTKFDSFQSALTAKYGEPTRAFKGPIPGTIWKEREDFMMGLLKKEVTLSTFWKDMKDTDVTTIMLNGVAMSRDKGIVTITYEFQNTKECLADRRKKADAGL